MTNPDFSIELPVGLERAPRHFAAASEIREWLNTERAAWQWLLGTRNQGGDYVELADKYNNFFTAMEQHISLLDSAIQSDQKEALTKEQKEVAGHVNNFNREGLFYSYMPEGIFLSELAKASPPVAAYALRQLVGRGSNLSQASAVEGAVRALLYRIGIDSRAEGQAAALINLSRDSELRLTEFRQAADKAMSDFHNEWGELTEKADKERQNYGEIIGAKQIEFNVLLEEGKARIANVEQTYDKKLALQKSVDYWNKRKRRHWTSAAVFGVASAGGGVGVAYYIHGLVSTALTGVDEVIHRPWKYGFVLIVLALAIWALRLIVRMFLTNVHLATDAGERETMVLTYLALLREGQALSDEDKSLIFSALFRPSQAMLGGDDAAPVSSAALLSRLLSGGK